MKLNYTSVMHQADKIDDLVTQLKKLRQKIINSHNELMTEWHGNAAKKYTERDAEILNEIDKMIKKIKAETHTIRDRATLIKKIDEEQSYNIINKNFGL